ncbi:MAG: HPF/RaiA family ribosome-associated protein [Burkholderiales bacterium]
MQIPLQITLRDIGNSEALEASIREKVAKLEELHHDIVSCRVTVEMPAKHKHQGKEFSIGIDIKVPGGEIAINRDHDEDIHIALRDAFAAARRKLAAHARPRRNAGTGKRDVVA